MDYNERLKFTIFKDEYDELKGTQRSLIELTDKVVIKRSWYSNEVYYVNKPKGELITELEDTISELNKKLKEFEPKKRSFLERIVG